LLAPDLTGTTFVAGYDFINSDTHPNDDNSHGTHVTGTIAQTTNNGIGVAGVAFNTAIMPVKVLNKRGKGTDVALADGIVWAADHGADVISMSLGFDPSLEPSDLPTLTAAVEYAWGLGVVLVASSGNEGEAVVSLPAAYPEVIAVGAVQSGGERASYSQYGEALDFVAPGGDGVDRDGDGYEDGVLQQTFNPTSKLPSDFGYWFLSGTSMAAPHVSGVAALLIANGNADADGDGETSPDEIRTVLQATATDLGASGRDDLYGWGLIDASAALQSVQYSLTVNTVGSGLVTKDPDQVSYASGTTVALTAVPDVGWTFTGWSGDLSGITNPNTITMTDSKVVTATFSVSNTDPVITSTHVWGYPGGQLDPAGSIYRGNKVRIYSWVSDLETPVADLSVTIKYKAQSDTEWTEVPGLFEPVYNQYYYCDWTIPAGASLGLYDVEVVVDDGDGGVASETELGEFNVVNVAPVVSSVNAWGTSGGKLDPGGSINRGQKVRIYTWVNDYETSVADLAVTIRFKAQSDSVWTEVSGVFESVYNHYYYFDWAIPAGASLGSYDVEVVVTDGDGVSTSKTETGEFNVVNVAPVVSSINAWGTPGGKLDPGGSISRGGMVRLYTWVSDYETPVADLSVTIRFKAQSDSVWTEVSAVFEGVYNHYYYYDWAIPMDATTGLYDVTVIVDDGDGGVTSATETGVFNVAT
jgi:uncharacterized repeat protein (TIGR02543 family)